MELETRLVQEDDADFIMGLRNNPKLNRHLSATSASVDDQIQWIRGYKTRELAGEEYYLIFLENSARRGLYRLYHINSVSFTIGSWLFDTCENRALPIMSDMLIGDVGFYDLNRDVMLFEVRKDNKKVIRYHAMKKPLFYNEDALHNYYLITKVEWEAVKERIRSFFGISAEEYAVFRASNRPVSGSEERLRAAPTPNERTDSPVRRL